jgi:hypothetical protein
VRPLPAGIPILPGQIKPVRAKRPLPVGLIIVLVIVGLGVLLRLSISYSDDARDRIDQAVTQAMVARVAKGTRLPITLRSGPRLLQIGNADVSYQGLNPTTCVQVKVLDAKTGAEDTKVNYPNLTCIEGLKYPIH